jgi:hypothetical protein
MYNFQSWVGGGMDGNDIYIDSSQGSTLKIPPLPPRGCQEMG